MHVDSSDVRDLVVEALTRHERGFFYKDHQLLKEEAYAELAVRLKKRSRGVLWAGGVAGILFGAMAAYFLVSYGDDGLAMNLFRGLLTLATALVIPIVFIRSATQLEESSQKALDLLALEEK